MTNEREKLPGSEREQEREQGEEHGGGIFDGPQGLLRRAMAMRHQQRIHRKKADGGADKAAGEHEVSQPGDAAEQEADHVADHVAGELHGDGEAKSGDKPHAGKEQAPAIGAKLKDGAISLSPKKGASPNQMNLPLPDAKAGDKKKDGDKKGELPPHADTKHVTVEDGKYVLLPAFRDCIREKFYATKYNSAVNKWKTKMLTTPKSKGGLRHETDPAQYFFGGQWFKNEAGTVATIGHENPTVCKHWNETGHNTAQPDRITYFNGDGSPETNLILQPASMNKSEGASKGERYTPTVGPNFKGPG